MCGQGARVHAGAHHGRRAHNRGVRTALLRRVQAAAAAILSAPVTNLRALPPALPALRCAVTSETRYGSLLAPFLADPCNLFIISSDFCHWGSRFSYTFTQPDQVCALRGRCWPSLPCCPAAETQPACTALVVPARLPCLPQGPIWKSIQWLDELGMRTIEQVRASV